MDDVSFFWLSFAAYLLAAFVLCAAAFRRSGAEGLARFGRGVVWLGLGAQTASIVWRAFIIGSEPPQLFFERFGTAFAAGAAGQAVCYALLVAVALAA
ncbi:MAG: hypothetical protein FJ291_30685, partial [Planctomycetes bacterium]|nr:hypothetical protein [Planctomycetota bacterium]